MNLIENSESQAILKNCHYQKLPKMPKSSRLKLPKCLNSSNSLSKTSYLIILSVLLTLSPLINCFNIDTLFPVEVSGNFPENSNESFGSSVLMYKNNREVQFLIGAPKDQGNGAIYKCSWTSGSAKVPCFRQSFTGFRPDNMSMNFGSNLLQAPPTSKGFDTEEVVTSGSNRFLTCAYTQVVFCNEYRQNSFGDIICEFSQDYTGSDVTKALPVGVCYLFDQQNRVQESIRPFYSWEHHYIDKENYLSHALLGFSQAFSPTGSELYLGIPGMNEFAGGAYHYKVPEVKSEQINIEPDVEFIPKAFNYTELLEKLYGVETRRIVMSSATKERLGNQFAGYTVGVAKFYPGSSRESLVIGAPRRDLAGAVDVYDLADRNQKRILQTLTGSQSGEYFGAAVVVLDVNADGSDDLVVGSPNFWNGSRGFEDQGKATVFLFDKTTQRLTSQVSVFGLGATKGRFGTAIASLGDINLDEFNDIVIGAPYEDNNSGAIYIYHGSTSGLKSKHSQRISALADLRSLTKVPTGFGYSFSSLDVDGNGFGDLLVGAYLSNSAVLLRTKPIMSIEPEIEFSDSRIKFTRVCSLTERTSGPQRNKRTCMELRFCVNCKIPRTEEPVDMIATLEADTRKSGDKRVYFTNNDNETSHEISKHFRLDRDERKCLDWVKFFVRDQAEIDDFILPVEFSLKFSISGNDSRLVEERWLKEPAFEIKNVTKASKEINIEMCNGNAVDCLSNIRLEHSLYLDRKLIDRKKQIEVLQGSSSDLTLSLKVSNTGEVAISPNVTIRLNTTSFELLKQSSRCKEPEVDEKDNGTAVITCDLDRLLTDSNTLDIHFLPFNETVQMKITVGIQNRLNEKSRTEAEIVFLPRRESNIGFSNLIKEDSVHFTEKQKSVPFSHSIKLEQKGKSPLDQTQIILTYPAVYRTFPLAIEPTITFESRTRMACQALNGTSGTLKVKKDRKRPKVIVPMNCQTPDVECAKKVCILERLNGSSEIFIKIEGVLYTDQIAIGSDWKTKYQMEISALVLDSREDFTSGSNFRSTGSVELFFESHISSEEIGEKQIWWILLAIIIAVIILILIILLCWRCGFFRRNRAPKPTHQGDLSNSRDDAETQPLTND